MSNSRHGQAIILLADGFEEKPVGTFLTTLREAGLSVNLVGLRTKQVSGVHGLTIVPDMSLERLLDMAHTIRAIILPDGVSHLARLRQDPRVNLLSEKVSDKVILIGLGPQTEQVICASFKPHANNFLILGQEANLDLDDFAQSVAHQLMEL